VTTTRKADTQRKPRSPRRASLAIAVGIVVSGAEISVAVSVFVRHADVVSGADLVAVGVGVTLSVLGVAAVVVGTVLGKVGARDGLLQEASGPAVGRSVPNRVAGWSVRLLPVQERERYRDEFAAELSELRGEPRRSQVGYALRLLLYSVRLRRVLRQPGPVPARQRDGEHDDHTS